MGYYWDLTIGSSAASLADYHPGSGNDTITMGTNLTAADVIDGGGNGDCCWYTGKDKLTATEIKARL